MFGGPVTKKDYGSNLGETKEANSPEKKGIAHGRGGPWMLLTRRGWGVWQVARWRELPSWGVQGMGPNLERREEDSSRRGSKRQVGPL